MKSTRIVWALLLVALLATMPNDARADKAKGITLTQIGRYTATGPTSPLPRAEISAYDPATKTIFAINAADSRIDVLDISTPHLPTALAPIPLGAGLLPNSIAVHDGIIAVALEATPKSSPGAVGKVSGRTHAFIGLERTGGVLTYDISDPRRPFFVHYANTRTAGISPDVSPEGVPFSKEDDSPNGKPLLVVSHEDSNMKTIFEINKN